MKYLKYGFFSIVKKPLFNVLIMLELAAILVVGNLTIATANSRSVFYDPYADIMSKEGYVYQPRPTNGNYDKELRLKTMYDSLAGDVSVRYGWCFQAFTDDEHFIDPLFDNDMTSRNIYAFDDSIYSKFNLPLEEGRWASCKKNAQGQIEAVVIRNKDSKIALGDVYKFYSASASETESGEWHISYDEFCDVVVVGIIGNGQYTPSLGSGAEQGKEQIQNLAYIISPAGNDADFYVASGTDERLRDDRTIGMSSAFITYNTTPTDEIRKGNELKLQSAGRCTVIDMSSLKANSDAYLYEQYIKMLPILLCVFLIVLTELICSVAMNTRRQMRNYGIYFLCGCRWRDVLRISLSYSLIILAGGLMLGGAAMAVFQTMEYAKMFEQNLALNNVWMTLALIGFMLAMSLVIPFVQVSRTSPVSTIKESA